jgi:hypothetical protein
VRQSCSWQKTKDRRLDPGADSLGDVFKVFVDGLSGFVEIIAAILEFDVNVLLWSPDDSCTSVSTMSWKVDISSRSSSRARLEIREKPSRLPQRWKKK